MKINELVEMYNNNNRIDINKVLDIKQYIGITYKEELAKAVLGGCITEVDGEKHLDSIRRYIMFTVLVIDAHTNLEFSESNIIEDYDMLCESGLLFKVIETFNRDYDACQEVLNMMTADIMQHKLTIEKVVYGFLNNAQEMLANVVDNFDLNSLQNTGLNQENLLDIYNAIKGSK